MEHIEEAGIHSGDSACSLPPYSLAEDVQDRLREQVTRMAKALNVVGLMNTQFAIQDGEIYVLEVNPRASRTVPFVSKATGLPLAKIAARCMVRQTLKTQGVTAERRPTYYSVKESVFPFIKFPGVDPLLGPEMKSTGEVMGVGRQFGEAYGKAMFAAGMKIPSTGTAFISVRDADKPAVAALAGMLAKAGFKLLATAGTAAAIEGAGLGVTRVNKVKEGRPHVVDMIKNGEIDLIVNTTEGKSAIAESQSIRSAAIQRKLTYFTTLSGARASCMALEHLHNIEVNRLQDLHREVKSDKAA
jgi:carbamoyl-phosphate synthase large subunit